ncbi:MAG: acyltransferase family protein [Pyrinomonadaceae bacterium]
MSDALPAEEMHRRSSSSVQTAKIDESGQRIRSLDGLRAVSICLVMVSHLFGTRGFLPETGLASVFELGELGVRVFFVISGFLITSIVLRELESSGRIRLSKFYFRRTVRIFPPYYAFLTLLVLLTLLGVLNLTSADEFHALTYTSNYFPQRSWSVAHTWSLAVEEQFYLLWPATLLLTGKRKALGLALAVILVSPFLRLILWRFSASPSMEIGIRFETIADSIATGCLLSGFRQWLHRQTLYNRLLSSKLFFLVPALVLVANAVHDRPRLSFFFGFTIMNVGIALSIDWCLRNSFGWTGRFLNARPVVFIGVISYSVYLWQQIFLNRYSDAIFCRFPLNFICAIAAALLSFWLIERPSLALRQRIERLVFVPSRQVVSVPLGEGEI